MTPTPAPALQNKTCESEDTKLVSDDEVTTVEDVATWEACANLCAGIDTCSHWNFYRNNTESGQKLSNAIQSYFTAFSSIKDLSTILLISGSRNRTILTISGSRNLSIFTISGSRNIIYPFFDVWSQKNYMLAIIYDSAHVDFWILLINDTKINKNVITLL